MNSPPRNSDLLQRLAADYVLGTMRGGARRRLQRWRAVSPELDEHCAFWEVRLMPLLLQLRPMRVPAEVWPRIEAQLGLRRAIRAPVRAGRMTAIAASLVLLGLAGLFAWLQVGPASMVETSSISTPAGAAIWEVGVRGRLALARQLVVQTHDGAAPPTARSYELWALPSSGKPVSLGVLPARAGSTVRILTVGQRAALALAEKIAVSVEPVGGSPTGQPTGAIAYVASLTRH